MTFEEALKLIKAGKKVSRTGWNGRGMWLMLVTHWRPERTPNEPSNSYDAWRHFNGGHVGVAPFIAMKTADDKIVPWLASQTDILAEDWELVQ